MIRDGPHPSGVGEICVDHQPDRLIYPQLGQEADEIRLFGQIMGQYRQPETGGGGGGKDNRPGC